MEQKFNPLQAMVDGVNAKYADERAKSQMTLSALIVYLGTLDGSQLIRGVGSPDSYRGYYSDLAFEPTDKEITADELLLICKNDCMGKMFEGYKGGDFWMTGNTPLWIASYGNCGERLIGFDGSKEVIIPITEPEED